MERPVQLFGLWALLHCLGGDAERPGEYDPLATDWRAAEGAAGRRAQGAVVDRPLWVGVLGTVLRSRPHSFGWTFVAFLG